MSRSVAQFLVQCRFTRRKGMKWVQHQSQPSKSRPGSKKTSTTSPSHSDPITSGESSKLIQRRLIDVSFIFWVRRIDGCLLETRTLEDLLGDVRLEDERIERFRLACREGTNSTDVEIIFSSDYASVRLEINSSQHDTAHLLASELRKYIGGTVLVNRISSGILAGTLFALALIMMVVAVLGSTPLFPAGQ